MSQCKIRNYRYNSVYITYVRVGTITLNGEPQAGIVLRLMNNSSCAIIISIESDEAFDLSREPVLPDVLHWLRVDDRKYENHGDAFQTVTVPGGRSALIGVPFNYLDEPDGLIDLPFGYKWEDSGLKDGSRTTVEHITYFAISQFPQDVIAQYTAQRNKRYPMGWFAPVNDSNKPDWEILPQEAVPGEVILSKRNELGILSNFAPTPFVYHDKKYASVEGFWQMMLYPEGPDDPRLKDKRVTWKYTREQVAQMTAFEAKAAGTLAEENMETLGIDWCTFDGKRFPYRFATPGEHYLLIVAAMRAKADQNPEVKRILLATGDLILKPDHHGEENPPPEWLYNEIWMQIRSELQKPELQELPMQKAAR
ncbi:MAG: NADAR family protein [Acidobacteriota bacterium]